MARRKPQPRTSYLKSSRKFDIPLFAAAWARGKAASGDSPQEAKQAQALAEGLVMFSGGGGEGHHGIKSKIIVARHSKEDEELSEEILSVSTGVAPAFKLAVHPNGDAILATFEKECKAYRLQVGPTRDLTMLEELTDLNLGVLQKSVEQKCVVFSPEGSRLASGDEEGRVTVVQWPSLEVIMDVKKGHTSSLRDADFNLDGTLLVTTADSGPGRVWDLSTGTAAATLSLVAGCRLGSCKFSRDERKPFLFTTAVKGGKGFVVVWDTRSWKQLGVKKLHNEPICSFAVNSNSSLLATGTTEGNVAIVDMKQMAIKQRVNGAHMVFVTGIQFSPDDKHLLSVSGDSSVRITPVTAKPSGPTLFHGALYFLLLVLLTIAFAYWFANSDFAERFFQFPLGRHQPAFPYWQQWPGPPPATPEQEFIAGMGGEL